MSSNVSFIDRDGATQQVELGLDVYKAASDEGMSVPSYINTKYEADTEHGTAFEQFLASCGLFLKNDRTYGVKAPSMKDVLSGTAEMNAGTIVRDANPASRILFPAVVLAALDSQLTYDAEGYPALFEQLIAVSDDIDGPRFEHPVIDYGPVGNDPKSVARSKPISQLSYPSTMVSITTSDVAKRIPTFSLGLEIADEALAATSLPLVTMALTRQGEFERIARIDEMLQTMVWGDKDLVMSDLSAKHVKARTLDSSIAGGSDATVLTHRAWVKWLRRNWRRRHIDWVLCNTDTALALEGRTGRPNYPAQDGDAKLINPVGGVVNPQWQDVKIMLVEDDILPNGAIVGLDSRYAIRRVRNSAAEYSAVEAFVLKKSQAMRFDFGEIAYRMYDDAWDVLTLGDVNFPADPR